MLDEILTAMERDHWEDFRSGFIAESPQKLRRILQYFAAIRGAGAYPPVRCNAPEFSAVIGATGRVQPCFLHSRTRRGSPGLRRPAGGSGSWAGLESCGHGGSARRHSRRRTPGVQDVRLFDVAGSGLSMATDSETMQNLLSPPRYGSLRLAIGKAMHWHYRLFRSRDADQAVLERVCGMPLLVMPGVLNPRLMRTGQFFASQLTGALLPRDAEVLDMGTGSGVCAIAAARHVRRVIAVDINQTAVHCARLNVLLNQADGKIEVQIGDLFQRYPDGGSTSSSSIRRSFAARRAAKPIGPGGQSTWRNDLQPD